MMSIKIWYSREDNTHGTCTVAAEDQAIAIRMVQDQLGPITIDAIYESDLTKQSSIL